MWQVTLLFALLAPASAVRVLRGDKNSTALKIQQDIRELDLILGDVAHEDADKASDAPSDSENPKCDQACTNGSEKERVACMAHCAKMQKRICGDDFNCHRACGNHIKQMPRDDRCEGLCDDVQNEVCYPLGFKGPSDAISPHHDDQPPPSVEATPAPKIHKGTFVFCNLYPASYEFEVLGLKSAEAKDGPVMTSLSYKQCDKVTMQSLQSVGLRVNGKLAGKSLIIDKTPSVMLFGQWAFGNHQIEFNRYFAKSEGPMLCNGFPMWEKGSKDKGQLVVFFRDGKRVTSLRYKECFPTSLKNGEVLSAQILGKQAGEYIVTGSPSAIVLGKAGETGAVAFEAWTDNEVGF